MAIQDGGHHGCKDQENGERGGDDQHDDGHVDQHLRRGRRAASADGRLGGDGLALGVVTARSGNVGTCSLNVSERASRVDSARRVANDGDRCERK